MKWSVHLTLRCICWNGCGLPVKYTTEKWSWDSTFDTRVWTNHPDGYKAKKEKKKKKRKKRKEKNPSCCCHYDCVIPSPGTTRISSQPSDWCWICCASVTPAVVTTEPQRKHTSHFTAILITLNMRPQESSAHFTLCFVLFFPRHVMVHVWPARVGLTATEAQLCGCVGVTAGAPLPAGAHLLWARHQSHTLHHDLWPGCLYPYKHMGL